MSEMRPNYEPIDILGLVILVIVFIAMVGGGILAAIHYEGLTP